MQLSDPTHVQLEALATWLDGIATSEQPSLSPVDLANLRRGARERAAFLRQFVIDDTIKKDTNGAPLPDVLQRHDGNSAANIAGNGSAFKPATRSFVDDVIPEYPPRSTT